MENSSCIPEFRLNHHLGEPLEDSGPQSNVRPMSKRNLAIWRIQPFSNTSCIPEFRPSPSEFLLRMIPNGACYLEVDRGRRPHTWMPSHERALTISEGTGRSIG
ncbi:hypothetical protein CDAR_385601 [Caerostris darwini]|uniref:Uncharacterized protein n=1 Tax=Caerostris darwini TaxID=1538125 RepID=A0AAV4M4R4_9ARAC|nr:hypothetical protein CDAR_385601 [Caerostris darwini]